MVSNRGAAGRNASQDETQHLALPEPEREANAFAAALLMPAPLVERLYAETNRDFDRLCPAGRHRQLQQHVVPGVGQARPPRVEHLPVPG